MKKLLSFFTALIAVIFTTNAQTCDNTLQLHDDWGDGWNGSTIQLTLSGVATVYGLADGADTTITVTVTQGDSIELEFLGGGTWDNEITYELLDYNGDTLYAEVLGSAAAGINYSGVSDCGSGAGISEEVNNFFSVYPNPNDGDFFVVNDGKTENVKLTVLDIQGKNVYNTLFNLNKGAKEFISLENLDSGMYIVVINTDNGRSMHNIVIQ